MKTLKILMLVLISISSTTQAFEEPFVNGGVAFKKATQYENKGCASLINRMMVTEASSEDDAVDLFMAVIFIAGHCEDYGLFGSEKQKQIELFGEKLFKKFDPDFEKTIFPLEECYERDWVMINTISNATVALYTSDFVAVEEEFLRLHSMAKNFPDVCLVDEEETKHILDFRDPKWKNPLRVLLKRSEVSDGR